MISLSASINKHENTKLFIDSGILNDKNFINNLIAGRNSVFITDDHVAKLYPKIIEDFNCIVVPQGEQEKNFGRINQIVEEFIKFKIDKNSIVIGFGGGVISDIAGFAASIFMRGVNFGFFPSTLLAQVDAAIGGKNGINFKNYKNYIGFIKQPEFIVCDINLLKTLLSIEYYSGLAEVIKYGLIADNSLFNSLNKHISIIKDNRDNETLSELVHKCIVLKNDIVAKDTYESNLRQILNFGHTFGHAIEIVDNIKHGQAIAKGSVIACKISHKLGYLNKTELEKILNLYEKYNYNISYEIKDKHFDILINDKKKNKDIINFILLEDIGKSFVKKFKYNELYSLIKEID